MKPTPVIKLADAAEALGISVRAAESALRAAGIKSGYPAADVAWLAANRPGRGSRTDLRKDDVMQRTQIEYTTGTDPRPTGHGWVTVAAAPTETGAARRDWARKVVAEATALPVSDIKILAVHVGSDDPESDLAEANWYRSY